MGKYLVGIREIHLHTVMVEAKDEQEALEKAGDGDIINDDIDLEYVRSLDHEHWSVESVSDTENQPEPKTEVKQFKNWCDDSDG